MSCPSIQSMPWSLNRWKNLGKGFQLSISKVESSMFGPLCTYSHILQVPEKGSASLFRRFTQTGQTVMIMIEYPNVVKDSRTPLSQELFLGGRIQDYLTKPHQPPNWMCFWIISLINPIVEHHADMWKVLTFVCLGGLFWSILFHAGLRIVILGMTSSPSHESVKQMSKYDCIPQVTLCHQMLHLVGMCKI